MVQWWHLVRYPEMTIIISVHQKWYCRPAALHLSEGMLRGLLKSCKNHAEKFWIPFAQIHLLFMFTHIALTEPFEFVENIMFFTHECCGGILPPNRDRLYIATVRTPNPGTLTLRWYGYHLLSSCLDLFTCLIIAWWFLSASSFSPELGLNSYLVFNWWRSFLSFQWE